MGLWDNIPIVKAKANSKSSLASYLDSKNASNEFLSSTANSVLQNNTVGEQRFALPDYGYPDLSKNRIIEAPVSSAPLNTTEPFNGSITASGTGNLSNGLWNNGVGAQNPLSVGYTPTQVDSVAKAPIGLGSSSSVQSSVPSPTLYASNQASNANGAPIVGNATISNPMQEATNPMDMSMSDAYNKASFDADPRTGLYSQGTSMNSSAASTPYSFMDNFTDFSSKDAAKNSLGNIATGVNVAGGLFDAYNKYQTRKAQADYQNRIASLYEKQYADTEARRAKAQANYDASVPK